MFHYQLDSIASIFIEELNAEENYLKREYQLQNYNYPDKIEIEVSEHFVQKHM